MISQEKSGLPGNAVAAVFAAALVQGLVDHADCQGYH